MSAHAPSVSSRSDATRPAVREGGVYLGQVLGVRLYADWSVLIIFFLIVLNLGSGLFPAWHPDWPPLLSWTTALGAALLFFASILAHELTHAVLARGQGVPVSRITLFLFGGLAHMDEEPRTPRAELLIAIGGPISSLLIGLVALAAGSALAGGRFAELALDDPRRALQSLSPIATLLLWLGPINLILGIFNLVPGFPLDGGRVFRAIAWWATGDVKRATRWASVAGRIFAWILMALGLTSLVGGDVAGGLWLLLIGWFLNNSARANYQHVMVREFLRDVPLAQVMRTRITTVRPDTSVAAFVEQSLMASDQHAFPVVGPADELVGLVGFDDVRKVPHARWGETMLSEIMTPADALTTLPADAAADRAFKALAQRGVDQIPVLEARRPVGLVRSQDLVKWLALHIDERGLSTPLAAR